jgi:uncharacterized RDD family membrane protein YckC
VGRRAIGAFFEGLIDLCALAAFNALIGVPFHASGPFLWLPLSTTQTQLAEILVFLMVWNVLTKVITLGMLGWTPGMFIMSVRCVRWDGRAPGLLRALGRTMFYGLYQQFGCLFLATVWVPMTLSKTHKGLQDMIVGTYVIDSMFVGHLLMPTTDGGVMVGPRSVHRKEAERYLGKQAAASRSAGSSTGTGLAVATGTAEVGAAALPPPPGLKSGEPFFDRNLGTYVLWSARQNTWLAFDRSSGDWYRIS